MMRVSNVLLALLCISPTALSQTSDRLPELNNYAWGFPVNIDERASFYTLRVPLAVYESASDPRLRDLGVYNAAGQAVPRVIEEDGNAVTQQQSLVDLPFAAMFRDQQPDADGVRLIFENMQGNTRIDIQSDTTASQKIRPPLASYIVDTRGLPGSIDALQLAWPDNLPGFVGQLQVDASDDLEHWQPVAAGALADLRQNGTHIVRRRVDLGGTRRDFLRLRWTDLPTTWKALEIAAVQVTEAVAGTRQHLRLNAVERDTENSVWFFDAGTALRVDELRLVLPPENSLLVANVYSWHSASKRWRRSHEGTFYHLQRGESSVSSPAVSISPVRSARWKVDVRGGNPGLPVGLELGWRPDTLLFVAQGNSPFTLATGRESAAAENFPENRLLGEVSLGGIATDNGPVARATLGEKFPLGGIVREVPKEPTDWRTVLLWSALVLAVLFVAGMAFRIVRGLNREDNL